MLVPVSPNVHAHAVGVLVDESVQFTVKGFLLDNGEQAKFATGITTAEADSNAPIIRRRTI